MPVVALDLPAKARRIECEPQAWCPTTEAVGAKLNVRDPSDGDGVGDTEFVRAGYGVYPSPDGSASNIQFGTPFGGGYPGRINRWDPATGVFDTYVPPYGSGPRGITVDSNGVVWTPLSGSGHLARFDRR